jgi:hypothetical protein
VVETGGEIFDHDLDAEPRRRIPMREDPPYEYQRLLVNPLLTVLVWIAILALLRTVVPRQNMAGLAVDIVVLALALLLIQFHCLDCGATGWLVRYQKHACPGVVARWQNRVVRRFHGPMLRIQLVAWLILTLATLVLGLVAFGSR